MYRKMLGTFSLLLMLLLPVSVIAADTKAAKERVEVAMRLSGTIDIEPDGSVAAVTLSDEDKAPAAVVRFVRASILSWAFEPVISDGRSVAARTPVSLRVVGKPQEDGSLKVAIRDAAFDAYDPESRAQVTRMEIGAPRYPDMAFNAGAMGEVFLLLKIGRDGRVQDVFAEQVNMRVIASEHQLQGFSRALAGSAMAAARNWKFRIPTEGEYADEAHWVIRMPVNYVITDRKDEDVEQYGRWQAYIPGPRQRAPWSTDTEWEGGSDALADGGVYMAGSRQGPRLLTPLKG